MGEWARCLLSMTLSGAALTLLVAGLTRLLRGRVPGVFCYGLWLLVLVRFLCPWGTELSLSHRAVEETVRLWVSVEQQASSAPAGAAPAEPGAVLGRGATLPLWETVTAVWAGGAMWTAGRYMRDHRRLRRALQRDAVPVQGQELELYRELTGGVAGAPELWRSPVTDTPVLVGVCRPRIYLPAGEEMPERYLRHALAHELTHWRRCDLPVKYLAAAVVTLHWFDPLARLAARELERDCELSCDQRVAGRLSRAERTEYGMALLWAAQGRRRGAGGLTAPLWDQKQCLKERLQTVMQERSCGIWSKFVMGVALVGTVTAFLAAGAYAGDVSGSEDPAPAVSQSEQGNEQVSAGEGSGTLSWPFAERKEITLTSLFGRRVHPLTGRTIDHTGIDILLEADAPVLSSGAGTVAEAGFDAVLGNYVVVDHGDGLTTIYGQLTRNDLVEPGETVQTGTQIGTVGRTGQATGYHLHFEVAESGTRVDPLDYLEPGRFRDPA